MNNLHIPEMSTESPLLFIQSRHINRCTKGSYKSTTSQSQHNTIVAEDSD